MQTVYTLETLRNFNPSYDDDHIVTQGDVDKVNQTIAIIEKRQPTPTDGDSVVIIQQDDKGKRTKYLHAHMQRPWCDDDFSICESPMVPFVTVKNGDRIATDASGGAWFGVRSKDLLYAGKTSKTLCVWGHCGGCANGAIDFEAIVNKWIVFVNERGQVIPPSTQEKTVKLELLNGNGQYYTKADPLRIVCNKPINDFMVKHIREYTQGLTFRLNQRGQSEAIPDDTAQVVRLLTMASTYKLTFRYTDTWLSENTLCMEYEEQNND